MTDFEIAQLTQRLNGATLTEQQALHVKKLVDLAVLRTAQRPAVTETELRRIIRAEIAASMRLGPRCERLHYRSTGQACL